MRNPKSQIANPEAQAGGGSLGGRAWAACRGVGFGIWVLGFGICLAGGAGCAKARAQTVPDGPPLAVPAPPPRVIEPPEEEQVAASPPVVEPLPAVTSPPPPRTTTRPAPASQPPAASQPIPPPAAPAAEPPRVTPPTAADLAEEKKVLALLQRASRDISRVTYSRLNSDGRTQYDQSKSLAEQAEQAIKDRNWNYATTLADKAATLAAELVGR